MLAARRSTDQLEVKMKGSWRVWLAIVISYPVTAAFFYVAGFQRPLVVALLPSIFAGGYVLFGRLIEFKHDGSHGFSIHVGSWSFLRTSLGQFCAKIVALIVLLAIADLIFR